jgi:excisionase family DNA binding protein
VSAAPALDIAPAGEPVAWAIQLNGKLRATLFVDEVAELLGVQPNAVRELCRTGRIRTKQLRPGSRNSRYLIPVAALLAFLNTHDDPIPGQ